MDSPDRIQLEGDHNILVHDAGLILLTPFIPQLFERLGISSGNQIPTAGKALEGAVALNYLAWGTAIHEAPSFGLAQFLCGLSEMNAPSANLELGQQERMECDQMLEQVIGHWQALGKQGIDSFRQNFLQREGILNLAPDPILRMNRNFFDVLLDRLPWNFKITHLPWLAAPIITEW